MATVGGSATDGGSSLDGGGSAAGGASATGGQGKCTEALNTVARMSQCEEECVAGEAEACSIAASRYLTGTYVRANLSVGLERALRGCELGSSAACEAASERYKTSAIQAADGGEPDLTRYLSLRRLAVEKADLECTAGRTTSCKSLAFWYSDFVAPWPGLDTLRAEEFDRRALELLQKGCDAGDSFSCRGLARCTKLGCAKLQRSLAAAVVLYAKACKLGDALACRYAFEQDAPEEVAAPFLERGCDLGDGESCYEWGLWLEGPEAIGALQSSCAQQSATGCEMLASVRKRAGDAKGARLALLAGCALSDTIACPK